MGLSGLEDLGEFSGVQKLCCGGGSVVSQLFSTPWTAARQASLSFTLSRSSLRLMSVESVMPPLVSPSGPFPSCLLLWLHVSEMYQKSLSCMLEVGEFEGVSLF